MVSAGSGLIVMLGQINLALMVWALAGPALAGGVVWLGMRTHESIVVSGAVAGERARQVGICADQLARQASFMTGASNEAVEAATSAATSIAPTPQAPADLVVMCKADPACRSRGNLP